MAILDKLTDKLQKHVWCIIVFAAMLLFWFIAFSVTGKADNIAVWLSIVLSIIVIGYMFVQAYEMRNLIAEGHKVMAEKAVVMEKTAGTLAERAEAVEEVSRLIFRTLQPTEKIITTTKTPPPIETYRLDASKCGSLILLFLYSLVKSQEHKKLVDVWTVAAHFGKAMKRDVDRDVNIEEATVTLVSGLYAGFVACIRSFVGYNSINMIVNKPWRGRMFIQTQELPKSLVNHVTEVLKNRITNPLYPKEEIQLKYGEQLIDEYFEKP